LVGTKKEPGFSTKKAEFSNSVRVRDQMCVVTHEEMTPDTSNIFEAAHLVPVDVFETWTRESSKAEATAKLQQVGGVSSIFSSSVGITLTKAVHTSFDKHHWSINPQTGKVEVKKGFKHDKIRQDTEVKYKKNGKPVDMLSSFGKSDFPSLLALEYHYSLF